MDEHACIPEEWQEFDKDSGYILPKVKCLVCQKDLSELYKGEFLGKKDGI
jgi:hypothetical protein